MKNKESAKHIKAKCIDNEKIVYCKKCKTEEVLEVDEKSMEGFMGQINQFTSKHLKCKGYVTKK